jgi:DNA transformation protein
MAVSSDDIDFALDLFSGLGPLTNRKMMGGLCIYRDGTIFALLYSDGGLFLKGQGAMADWMIAQGWERWTYTRDTGKTTAMPYWRLPDSALDDPEEACALARRALESL